jgi:hypothetical protein
MTVGATIKNIIASYNPAALSKIKILVPLIPAKPVPEAK